jgi:ribonuclease-3
VWKLLLNRWLVRFSPEEKKLDHFVRNTFGFKPTNIKLFVLALRHSSASVMQNGIRQSNERLEYLGDAVLGVIIAEFLFKKYPYKDEGFLTEIRSRIVNRESLNELAFKLGFEKVLLFENRKKVHPSHRALFGDAFEAFIGAVYLDKGYKFTRKLFLSRILPLYFDIDLIIETTRNYKSKVIEWAQRQGKEVEFELKELEDSKKNKHFKAVLLLDMTQIAEGFGLSKKRAEQDAARKASELLNLE